MNALCSLHLMLQEFFMLSQCSWKTVQNMKFIVPSIVYAIGYAIRTSMPCHKASRNCASVLISIFLDQHNTYYILHGMCCALHSFFLTFNVCIYLFVSSAFPIIFFSIPLCFLRFIKMQLKTYVSFSSFACFSYWKVLTTNVLRLHSHLVSAVRYTRLSRDEHSISNEL